MNIEAPDQLISYLEERGILEAGEVPEVRILTGGVSNRTVFVRRAAGPNMVLKQALSKLRVATEWLSDPTRIHREAEGMRVLKTLLPAGAVPAFVFEDWDWHILAMAAVPMPHENWKDMLLRGEVDFDLVGQFGKNLGLIHQTSGVAGFDPESALWKKDFFESLRLEPYYAFAALQQPSASSFLHKLIDETRAHTETIVHGDYSPKNILVYENRLILLDHEVIHIGDPSFDIGFSMTHFLCKANHLRPKAGLFGEAARRHWLSYGEVNADRGEDFEGRAVRHTIGCILARVDGRSPVEYLNEAARSMQRDFVLDMMRRPPGSIPDLIEQFIERCTV